MAQSRGVTLPRGCAGCFAFRPTNGCRRVDPPVMQGLRGHRSSSPPSPPEPGPPEPRSTAIPVCEPSSTNHRTRQAEARTLSGRAGEIARPRTAPEPLQPTSADMRNNSRLELRRTPDTARSAHKRLKRVNED